jgi:TolB-like protein
MLKVIAGTVIAVFSAHALQAQQNELRSLANSLAQDIAATGKKSIAVVDFTDLQGNTSELGRFLAEEFSVALLRTHKGFEVVERNYLKAILSEHKLAATGLIDPSTAKKLGQFTGADALVTGSLTPFSEHVRVAVKVLATDTARIIAADDADLPKTQTIADLLGNSIGGSREGRSGNDRSPTGGRPPSTTSQTPSSGPPPTSPVVVSQEFQYELLECRGMANSVRCSFRITNRGKDRTLGHSIYDTVGTKAFDNLGNESAAVSGTIANRQSENHSVQATLISDVPVQASLLFPNVSASASSLSLIVIVGFPNIKVSFRNVPIVR